MIGSSVLIHIVFVYVLIVGLGSALRLKLQMSSFKDSHPHLHSTVYPNDDYNHIYGYTGPAGAPELSKLQNISALRIADTIRNKVPLDTVWGTSLTSFQSVESCAHQYDFCYSYLFKSPQKS